MRLSPDALEAKLITSKCLDLFCYQLGKSITENVAMIHPSSQTLGLPIHPLLPNLLSIYSGRTRQRGTLVNKSLLAWSTAHTWGKNKQSQRSWRFKKGKERGKRTREEK